VSGKDVTPFLLQWLFERTEGRTLQANIALV
jgi:pseudouridine-5'-phosphate glycosidase